MPKLTLEDIRLVAEQKKRVRLSAMAEFINANLPGLKAEMESWHGSFDRKVGRLRSPGVSRDCMKLVVKDAAGRLVVDHNPMETYRSNPEVARWVIEEMETGAKARALLAEHIGTDPEKEVDTEALLAKLGNLRMEGHVRLERAMMVLVEGRTDPRDPGFWKPPFKVKGVA